MSSFMDAEDKGISRRRGLPASELLRGHWELTTIGGCGWARQSRRQNGSQVSPFVQRNELRDGKPLEHSKDNFTHWCSVRWGVGGLEKRQ